MTDPDPIDSMAPWTIKAISVATRETVTKAARREGLTVGQWLERRVAEWEGQGSPVRLAPSPPGEVSDLGTLAAVLSGMGAAGLPVPKHHVAKLTGALLRQAGLSPPRPEPGRQPARLPPPAEPDNAAGADLAPPAGTA